MHHHGEALRRLTNDDNLVAQLKRDHTSAPISAPDRTMLDYVAKLTRVPASIVEQDIEALRDVGFSDRAILDIAQITAYFAFVNRLANGAIAAIRGYSNPPPGPAKRFWLFINPGRLPCLRVRALPG